MLFLNLNRIITNMGVWFLRTSFSSVHSLSRVRLSATPWTAARQASLSITNSWSLLKFMPIESVMPSSHLILRRPLLSCPQSLPASGSFPMSQLFAWGGQSIGVSASASVLPMNTQDWSPLGWTSWISLQSKGLSRVFPNTIVQKHQFFGTQLSSLYLIRARGTVITIESMSIGKRRDKKKLNKMSSVVQQPEIFESQPAESQSAMCLSRPQDPHDTSMYWLITLRVPF